MKIIIINGHATAGKNTVVEIARNISGVTVNEISTVDEIVRAAMVLGYDGVKTDKARKFLSDMKYLATAYNDHSFNYVLKKVNERVRQIAKESDSNLNVFFVHVREPIEILKLKQYYGENCITLLVDRHMENIPDNHADMLVMDYNYDYIIENNGTKKSLRRGVLRFFDEIAKEAHKFQSFPVNIKNKLDVK